MLDGWTALMYASMNGFVSIVEYLVNHGGAEISATDRLHRTSLHWACRFNNLKVAQKLLSLGIRYDQTDIEMQTPIEVARRYRNYEIETLLEGHDKQKKQEQARKRKMKIQKEKMMRDQAEKEEKKRLLEEKKKQRAKAEAKEAKEKAK
mmetsp:Transcript_1356/g.1773  ORF Transcript_1356/g.1773 Transcript_1356/m.1773 type:complete len:149 (+) Transcript_1356:669-1115(+)